MKCNFKKNLFPYFFCILLLFSYEWMSSVLCQLLYTNHINYKKEVVIFIQCTVMSRWPRVYFFYLTNWNEIFLSRITFFNSEQSLYWWCRRHAIFLSWQFQNAYASLLVNSSFLLLLYFSIQVESRQNNKKNLIKHINNSQNYNEKMKKISFHIDFMQMFLCWKKNSINNTLYMADGEMEEKIFFFNF